MGEALKGRKSDVSEPYRSDLARNAGVEVRKEPRSGAHVPFPIAIVLSAG